MMDECSTTSFKSMFIWFITMLFFPFVLAYCLIKTLKEDKE